MEGGLQKPTRFDIDWKNKDYLDEELFEKELRRVADACHGCSSSNWRNGACILRIKG